MNLKEILIDPETVVDDGQDDSITLRDFTDDNISPEMAELLGHLKHAESWGQVRAILSSYCDIEDGGEV